MTKKVEREIERAAIALGFRQKPTFKQAERKLFALMAAGPSPRKWKKSQAYFQEVVKPYVDLALLIDRVEDIKAEIESRPQRIAEIRHEARKLAAETAESRSAKAA